MCKFLKKALKVIAIIIAIAGAAAAVYFAVKKITARKACAVEEFVPCECCDCEECSDVPAEEEEAADDSISE